MAYLQRPSMVSWFLWIGWTSHAHALPPSFEHQIQMVRNENRYAPPTELDALYDPATSPGFPLPFYEIPVEDLHVVQSEHLSRGLQQVAFVERGGRSYVRFFYHPISHTLYQPLAKDYRSGQFERAIPRASNRSLLTDNPMDPSSPFVSKVSLNQMIFAHGRAVPGWEVRRSVAINDLFAAIPQATRRTHRFDFLPEVFGAYVDKSRLLKALGGETQGAVFEHGFLLRDPSLLKNENTFPLFAALDDPKGGGPSRLVQWWRASGLDWPTFLRERFLRPIIESIAYLTMYQGLIPDTHVQNVYVTYDFLEHRVDKVIHQDLGSVKVDLRLRMKHGLDSSPLKTAYPGYDFKPRWGHEMHARSIYRYFLPYIFGDEREGAIGNVNHLKSMVPTFSVEEVHKMIDDLMREQFRKYWQVELGVVSNETIEQAARAYVTRSVSGLSSLKVQGSAKGHAENYVKLAKARRNTMELFWQVDPREATVGDVFVLPEGVAYRDENGMHLALFSQGFTKDNVVTGERLHVVAGSKIEVGDKIESLLSDDLEHVAMEKREGHYALRAVQLDESGDGYLALDFPSQVYLRDHTRESEVLVEVVDDLSQDSSVDRKRRLGRYALNFDGGCDGVIESTN